MFTLEHGAKSLLSVDIGLPSRVVRKDWEFLPPLVIIVGLTALQDHDTSLMNQSSADTGRRQRHRIGRGTTKLDFATAKPSVDIGQR